MQRFESSSITVFGKAYYAMGPTQIAEIVASPNLCRLHSISFHECPNGVRGVRALCESERMAFLECLSLSCYGFNAEDYVSYAGLSAILESPYLNRVEKLTLNNCAIDDECCRLIARSPRSTEFTHLDLSNNSIGDGGLAEILESPHLNHLLSIDLRKNYISKKSLKRAKSHFGKALQISRKID